MAYLGNPEKAIELYIGDHYIQHNPAVGDGTQPFIDYFTRMYKEYPDKSIEICQSDWRRRFGGPAYTPNLARRS